MHPTSRAAWALIAAVLAVHLIAVLRAGPPPLVGDSMHYHDIATNLAAGRGFAFSSSQQMPWQRDSLGTPRPTALRPPLYPVFLSTLYRAGLDPFGVLVVQAVLAGITAWLIYRLSRRVGLDDREACVAVAAYLGYPLFAAHTVQLVTETLFVPLVLASGLALLRAVDRGSVAEHALAGLLMGLAALTRPTALPLPLVLVPFVWRRSTRPLPAVAAMLAVFALVLSPWVIRNQRTFDRFEPSITMSGRNLFTGTYPASRGGSTLTDAQQPADIVAALPGLDEFQIDSVYNVAAARNLREHPAEQVPLALSKLVRCWFQVAEPGMFRPTFRSLMLNAPLLAAGLWGWRRLRSRRAPHLWLPVLVVAYAVLFQVLTIASVRYNLFAWPFMFMGVAVTVLGAWDAVTRRRAARAVPSRS